MQLDYLITNTFFLVGNLWIVRQGIMGIANHRIVVNLRNYKRVHLNVSAVVLSAIYVLVGIAATLLNVLSFFQTDFRMLQLIGVLWVALILITIFANWFARDP